MSDERETYLGDGLYCRFDGYQFILRAPREDMDHWVALEPPVLANFIKFTERWKAGFRSEQPPRPPPMKPFRKG